jgi:para-nitrobenzyl esterase
MRRALMICCLMLLAACAGKKPEPAPAHVAEPASLRRVSGGEVIGYASGGAYAWRAIPFAAPPVGDLRWRAPRPPLAWAARREALKPAPWCPQVLNALDGVNPKRYGEIVGQEDCLYLDIYAPALSAQEAAGARLPVMMWIHGGSNVWGRAEQYDASALAARQKVVVVVVQYRFGFLGWFAHEAIRAGGSLPQDASPNFGTLDQIRALEWIRDEIGAFGGDAQRVTVFGESAGGHNVAALLVSPMAKGLFHRAIIQSGSFQTVSLAKAEGLEGDRPDSGRAIAAKLLPLGVTGEKLRALPVKTLFAAYSTKQRDFDPPRVIADGIVLPAGGMLAALADPTQYNLVPVITGTNRDEARFFNLLQPQLVKMAYGRFPVARDRVFFERLSDYQSRAWRASAVDEPANAMVAGGHSKVWAYRFDWDEEGRVFVSRLDELIGAAHSMEIPFVFGRFTHLGALDRFAFTPANAPGRLALSDAMMSYWAHFAASGEPGQGVDGKQPAWVPWSSSAAAPKLLVLDTAQGGGVRMIPDQESLQRVAKDLFADPAVPEARRCDVFAATKYWNPQLVGAPAGRCPVAAGG